MRRPIHAFFSTSLVVVLAIYLMAPVSAMAQTGRIEGVITDAETGESLPGATVQLPDIGRGVAADAAGGFAIDRVPVGTHDLRVSFVGYRVQQRTVEVLADEVTTVDIALTASRGELDEIVVTAQQVERQAKSLGYSVTSIDAEELARTKEPNVVKSLQGKVPGINVTTQSGNVGGSARIELRGLASLGGDNQPLFVIDGVPVFNSNINSGDIGTLLSDGNSRIEGSYDTGNRLGQIDPANIKTVSVLKGAAAAALYGQRAKNGVILIETKTGRDITDTSVQFSSSLTTVRPGILPDFQNAYGPGDLGKYDLADTDGWGPRLRGQEAEIFTGETAPLRASPDNVSNFYRTGLTYDNNVSISSSTGPADFRLGIGQLSQSGIVPNSELDRTSVNLNAGTAALDDRLEARIGANYLKEQTQGRVAQGGNDPNLLVSIINQLPRNVSDDLLANNFIDEAGGQISLTQFTNNPYWITEQNPFTTDAERFFGFGRITYNLYENVSLQGRFGADVISESRRQQSLKGTIGAQTGEFAEDLIRERQFDSDFSVRFDQGLSEDFRLQGIFGQNINQTQLERVRNESNSLNVDALFNFTNARSNTPTNLMSKRRIVGVYGDLTLGFRDYVFLAVTGRNDWSSTLPEDNRSFFYPSVNLSFVFSDFLSEQYDVDSRIFSYGKLRLNYAEVGSDEEPYQLSLDFIPNASVFGQFGADIEFPFNGLTAFEASETIPPVDLKPQRQRSWEIGTELGFLDGRLNVDFTYYNQRTEDQIISLPVAQSTGFNAFRTNVGEISNKGVEATLVWSPIVTSLVSWQLDTNFSRNTNRVESLAAGIEEFVLDSGFNGFEIRARPGEEIGIFGQGFERDPDTGLPVINPDTGLRQEGSDIRLGDLYPDFTFGFGTTVSVGPVGLSLLVDWSQGGSLYSNTVQTLQNAGLVDEASSNRLGTFVDEGVIVTRNAAGEIVDRRPNDVPVQSMEDFWGQFADSGIIESGVYDATYVKLREASLRFTAPSRWFAQSPIRSASLSVQGRNLLLLYSKVPHIDPETNLFGSGAAVGQGLEFNNLPNTRTVGATLNFTF